MSPFLYRLATDIPLMLDAALVALLQPGPEPMAAEHPSYRELRQDMRPRMSVDSKGIATVPVQGALARNPSVRELAAGRVEDTDAIRGMIDTAAADSNISGIVLAIDSPGGFFTGGPELADSVAAARIRKPVVAHVQGMAASLGYMIASQADLIVASPSASVGSIGAIAAHADLTKFWEQLGVQWDVFRSQGADLKAPGAYNTALTDSQRENIQTSVDQVAGVFTKTVQRSRPGARLEGLRGRMFMGHEAADLGLLDWMGPESLAKGLILARS